MDSLYGMSELTYRYELEEGLVIIDEQQLGYSVYTEIEQVLTSIEAQVGSIAGKHILCEGQDGFWDLVVPTTKGKLLIYPLSALSLDDAKVKLDRLLASGRVLGKVP